VSAQEMARQARVQPSEALGPETNLLAQLDPADFGTSRLTPLTRAWRHPAESGRAWVRLGPVMAGIWPTRSPGAPRETHHNWYRPRERQAVRRADMERQPPSLRPEQAYLALRRLG
jgi:hypothetical protein